MKKKSEALQKLQEFTTWIQQQAGQNIKCFWSDNRREYNSKKLQAWFKKTGIQWEPTVSYTADQNGISKQTNRTLMERVQFVLYRKNLDKTLWAKIANTVIYLKNRSPTTVLQRKTPHKAWYDQKSDLSYLQILGCTAHLHVSKKTRKKLDSHTKRCILVGYSGTNIYKLWDPEKSMVIRGQDVVFDKRIQQLEPPTIMELESQR